MPRSLTSRSVFSLSSLLLLVAFCGNAVLANPPLKGGVSEQGEKEKTGLDRSDIHSDPNADPFDEGKMEEISPSPDSMRMEDPRKPLNGNVRDQGRGQMQPMIPKGNPFEGEEEAMPQPPPQQPPMSSRVQQNDPDNSPDMQLAWDIWHHRVAEAIYSRFNFLAKLAFRHSPPLLCQVSYVVTRDGHIQNIQVQQKSSNVLFNVIVFQTVKSLDGDMNLLQYPQGSRRTMVPKVGTFTQNYGGDGFKYTVGDRETLQGQGRR